MRINAVYNDYNCRNQKLKIQKKQNFKGYESALIEHAKNPIKTQNQAEDIFRNLLVEISKDYNYNKSSLFDIVKYMYEEYGLKKLFKYIKNYHNTYLSKEISTNIENTNEGIALAKKNDSEIFSLWSFSGQRKDLRFTFNTGKQNGANIEFYTDKKPDLFIDQYSDKQFTSTGFYSETGTPKVVVTSYSGGKPDRTYFNKDGSKPFFKNWIFGGTPVEGIY